MESMNNELMSASIESLAAALCKAQAVIENVSKDRQGYGYKYADLASCLSSVKKPLADNGLSVSQLVSQDSEGKQILVTLLLHESGQWLKSIFLVEKLEMKKCNSLQELGCGLTYARRYAFCGIVGLSQEDDDAHSVNKSVGKNETKDLSITQELDVAKKLMGLCKDNDINAQKFATFHNIDSNNIETVKKGVMNFSLLKEQFLNVANTVTQ